MGFGEHLEGILKRLDGAVAASVMGFDGIPVETVELSPEGPAEDIDVNALLVEYSNILNQLRGAAELLQSGSVTEISINSEKIVTIARLLSDEYFVIVALLPSANYGKARYLLRVTAPDIAAEI